MRVLIKTQGGIAIDPRTNVYFNVGDILEVGFKNLSKQNLDRIIELGLATELPEVNKVEPARVEAVVEVQPEIKTAPEESEYKKFTKPNELRKYAEEKYGIVLNKKSDLTDMVKQFENELEGDL